MTKIDLKAAELGQIGVERVLDASVTVIRAARARALNFNETKIRKTAVPLNKPPIAGALAGVPFANQVTAASASLPAATANANAIGTVPDRTRVVNPPNLYSEIGPSHLSPAERGDLGRVYPPNLRTNDGSVLDPVTMNVVDRVRSARARST